MIANNTARAASVNAVVSVVSVTRDEFRELAVSSPHVHHVFSRHAYGASGDYAVLPRLVRRIERVTRWRSPTFAHLVGAPLVLAPWLRAKGSKVVAHVTLTQQAYLPWVDRVRARLAWRLFDRWIAAYACSSAVVREELVARGQRPEKLHVVPPPVDVDAFTPGDRIAARRQLGWDENAFVVAYIGTVSPLRFPVETVLSALTAVAPAIRGLRLEVFAPLATHEYNVAWAAGHLEAQSTLARFPVTTNVRDLSDEEKQLVYRGADVLLLPFAAPVAVEPPLTLLEGMACGAVALVAPYANRSGIVRHGENGFTWDGPGSLAETLLVVARSGRATTASVAASARETVVNGYSIGAAAEAIRAVWGAIGDREDRPVPRADTRIPSASARGATVAVVGPDGAGKSTLVAALHAVPELETLPIYMGVDRRKATHSLPTTRWLVRRLRHANHGRDGSRTTRTTAGRMRRRARDLVALPHELMEFGFRYLVGWWARRDGRIVIFDRYIYDPLIDARVDGRGGWERFRGRVFATLFPAPDLIIVLEAPGSVLYARKGEHGEKRLDLVRRETARMASRARRAVFLDASEPIADVTARAVEEIRALTRPNPVLAGRRHGPGA